MQIFLNLSSSFWISLYSPTAPWKLQRKTLRHWTTEFSFSALFCPLSHHPITPPLPHPKKKDFQDWNKLRQDKSNGKHYQHLQQYSCLVRLTSKLLKIYHNSKPLELHLLGLTETALLATSSVPFSTFSLLLKLMQCFSGFFCPNDISERGHKEGCL